MRITIVAGTRPNFMKVAPVIRACGERGVDVRFIHTGQHYDYSMSGNFIEVLGLPEPDVDLEIGSGSDGYQCGETIKRVEEDLIGYRPDVLVVVGDVNSTMGAALAATKLHIPVAHVEAGLRSFNRNMPEEINRLVVDTVADYLFITEESGRVNLLREGVAEDRIFMVGNTMIDSLVRVLETAGESDVLERLGLEKQGYCFATLHRPSNVDDPVRLEEVLDMLAEISRGIKVVIPVHPRTGKNIDKAGLRRKLEADGLLAVDPVGYADSLTLISGARVVITDSGGVQEETTFLKVPCVTLRPETERPVTVETGTNFIVTDDCGLLKKEVLEILGGKTKKSEVPPLWDGRAAGRIVDTLQAVPGVNYRNT